MSRATMEIDKATKASRLAVDAESGPVSFSPLLLTSWESRSIMRLSPSVMLLAMLKVTLWRCKAMRRDLEENPPVNLRINVILVESRLQVAALWNHLYGF